MKNKTIARLYHSYKQEETVENGKYVTYSKKTSYCICFFYGFKARDYGEELREKLSLGKFHPIEYLIENGFDPVTDDNFVKEE